VSRPDNDNVRIGAEERRWVESRAAAAGFDLSGLAAVPDPQSADAQTNEARFAEFVALGRAGEMEWLKRTDDQGELLRGDLRRAVPWARSVLVCALNYGSASSQEPLSVDPAAKTAGWIARYAWSGRPAPLSATAETSLPAEPAHEVGSDYHDVLLPKLQAIERDLRARFGEELLTRTYVDTGPIVERTFAAAAGVGWVAKNTCVLNGEQGSWLLLGVVITSLELEPDAAPALAVDRCGTCTRCLEACPTGALVAPRQMDASLCISYLTIEKKGSIAEELRAPMGRQVFGCDICQDVCPWNARAKRREDPTGRTEEHALPPRRELVNPELGWLAALDGPSFNRWFRGSPLERTRRKRVLRNVAIAMGNSGQQQFVPQLEAWQKGDDPVLAEAAAWALQRISSQASFAEAAGEEESVVTAAAAGRFV
jgi:epoxyqueuosine reductase